MRSLTCSCEMDTLSVMHRSMAARIRDRNDERHDVEPRGDHGRQHAPDTHAQKAGPEAAANYRAAPRAEAGSAGVRRPDEHPLVNPSPHATSLQNAAMPGWANFSIAGVLNICGPHFRTQTGKMWDARRSQSRCAGGLGRNSKNARTCSPPAAYRVI